METEYRNNTSHILNLVKEKITSDPHCVHFTIRCLPDIDFNKDYIVKYVRSQEGWSDNFIFDYKSDAPWVSVNDEFSRKRDGYIIITRNDL